MNRLSILFRLRGGIPGRWRSSRALLFSALVAVLLSLGLSQSAQAGLVRYTVSGVFDTGSLSGKHYLETFVFDDAGRPLVLGSTPWTTPLLDFQLEVESHTKVWSLDDWPLEHFFSLWLDAGGFTNSQAHVSTPGPRGHPPAYADFFDDGAPHSRTYHVKWYDWDVWNTRQTDSTDVDPQVVITQVPEPGSLALVLLALLLVGGQLIGRAKKKLHGHGQNADESGAAESKQA
ncbi:PEP-CTERM sorting domain-containing protein [Roseateles sp. DB2]|uniref:PEP-CTERM sorting domain-containing protein n=1 Tax=Roseateles sp. DB2 TaxID=3453717 RepID=UPI003EED63E2